MAQHFTANTGTVDECAIEFRTLDCLLNKMIESVEAGEGIRLLREGGVIIKEGVEFDMMYPLEYIEYTQKNKVKLIKVLWNCKYKSDMTLILKKMREEQ